VTISNALICDDKVDRAERWRGTVSSRLQGAVVNTLTGGELAELLTELSDAEDDARAGNVPNSDGRPRIQRVEQAQLLILDSDLSPAPGDRASLSEVDAHTLRNGYGDDVARQLRSYTKAPAIVVVNMFWGRHARPKVFDLTLSQNVNAVADLTVTAGELDDDFLWGASEANADSLYRPWQRATIPEVVSTFKRSAEAAASLELDANVFEHLGIDPGFLTPSQLDAFTLAPNELKFRDLADSRLGFKYSGAGDGGARHEPTNTRMMAASVLRRWLERSVIPSQTLLLDAPHLAERYWRVLTPDPSDLSVLDHFADQDWDGEFGPFALALKGSLRPFVNRPVFDAAIARKVAAGYVRVNATSASSFDAAFAEDTSRFRPLDELTQFPSDVSGDFKHRWLEEVAGVGYEPANRLLL